MQLISGNIKTFEVRKPHEMADLKTFTDQNQSCAIKADGFDALAVLPQKNKKIPLQKLLFHPLSHQHGQPLESRAHIDEFIKNENPMSGTE